MEFFREPSTEAEERIDFERIQKAQERRHADTLQELRGLLFRMQRRAIAYATEELVKNKKRAATAKFKLPLTNKYREVLRRRALSAHRRGRQDVTDELGARKAPPMSGPDLSRVRAHADLLAKTHMDRLSADLQKAWSKAMAGKVDKAQMIYVTRQVFADFAGWEQPIP